MASSPARTVARSEAISTLRWGNLVRVVTSVPAFGLLAWALVLCGRETA